MFDVLDWPPNASRGLSSEDEFLVLKFVSSDASLILILVLYGCSDGS